MCYKFFLPQGVADLISSLLMCSWLPPFQPRVPQSRWHLSIQHRAQVLCEVLLCFTWTRGEEFNFEDIYLSLFECEFWQIHSTTKSVIWRSIERLEEEVLSVFFKYFDRRAHYHRQTFPLVPSAVKAKTLLWPQSWRGVTMRTTFSKNSLLSSLVFSVSLSPPIHVYSDKWLQPKTNYCRNEVSPHYIMT